MKFTLLLMCFTFTTSLFAIDYSLPTNKANRKKIVVSLGDFEEKDKVWKKEVCNQVYNMANQIAASGVDILCREFSTKDFHDKALSSFQITYDYHLRITKNSNDHISADLTNWKPKNATDFKSLAWDFKDNKDSPIKKEDAFSKVVANIFYFIDNEEAYKAALLVHGVQESDSIIFDEKNGRFLDKLTHEEITITKAYALFEHESERKKNYLRTGIEIGVQLSAGMAIYYKNLVYNKQDFDYGLKDGLKAKFNGEAILFDDNDKWANYGHVYAGVLYYQTARANGFNSLESALITFASSAAWEFMEYHEVFSINDQILTPIGGYVIGEATYQISCALLSKNKLGSNILGYTLNPNLAYNHAIDKAFTGNKYAGQPDCKKARWSDISVYVGLEKGQKAFEPAKNKDYLAGIDATVIKMNDYNKEGKDNKVVMDTAIAKLFAEYSTSENGMGDLKIIAQVAMAAYHQKNQKYNSIGQLEGYDFILGIGSGSTWFDRGGEEDSAYEDFYGTINILGANAHINLNYKGFNIRADVAIYGDFAMVKSYSLNQFSESRGNDLSDQNGLMRKRGYYFGLGASTLASISVSKNKWEVGYQGQLSNAKSINERHRIVGTSDDTYRDTFSHNKFYISYALTKNLKFQLSHEINVRRGSVNNGHKSKGKETRTMGTLVYKF